MPERLEKWDRKDRVVEVDRLVAVDRLVNALTTEPPDDMLLVSEEYRLRPKRGFHRSLRRTLPFLVTTPFDVVTS